MYVARAADGDIIIMSISHVNEYSNDVRFRCHVCKKPQTNMPTLKKHILQHIPKSSRKS